MASTKVLEDKARITPQEVITAGNELVAPTHEDVAELAYSYWEARGGHGGSPWEDWFRAEQELKRRGE